MEKMLDMTIKIYIIIENLEIKYIEYVENIN
jgi:hypothetical protein